jgi:ABC-type amino acid transport substrate-binding protein
MKKPLLLTFLILSMSCFAQIATLKLASDIWPPFSNVEGEKSIASDLVNEALNRQEIQTTTELIVFGDVIKGMESGSIDGSAALWITDERKKDFLFSDPYLNNQLVLVGPKGSDVSATSFEDLTGKRLGVIENYAYGDINETQHIILISGNGNQQNLERLLSGKIDFMLVDALIIQYMLKYQLNDVTEFLEIGKAPLLVKSLHFGIGRHVANAEQIINRFNEEIQNMITDGTYHRILELNWIQMDVDGDGSLELVLEGDLAGLESPQNTYGILMDLSYNEKTKTPKRYYIDGKMYEDWDEVPKSYKMVIPIDNMSNPNDIPIHFRF